MIIAFGVPALRSVNGKPTKTYDSWKNIKKRCSNPAHPQWADYGGRGIHPCKGIDESFEVYIVALGGEIPEGMSVDRTDNSGGYWCGRCEDCKANGHPLNIRTATRSEQNRNRRNSVYVDYDGELLPLAEHCERLNISRKLVYVRIRSLGWSIEDALLTPPGMPRPRHDSEFSSN